MITTTCKGREAYKIGIAFGHMGQHEHEIVPFLAWVAERKPIYVCEIGVSHGALTRAFLEIAPVVIGVDDPTGDGGLGEDFARARDAELGRVAGARYVPVPFPSLDTRALECFQFELDVLFIDGDHRGDAPLKDYEAYLPLMAPNGVIAFHDINSADHPGVGRHFASVRYRHPRSFTISAGLSWGGIGVILLGEGAA